MHLVLQSKPKKSVCYGIHDSFISTVFESEITTLNNPDNVPEFEVFVVLTRV